jgi:hypothetical protein
MTLDVRLIMSILVILGDLKPCHTFEVAQLKRSRYYWRTIVLSYSESGRYCTTFTSERPESCDARRFGLMRSASNSEPHRARPAMVDAIHTPASSEALSFFKQSAHLPPKNPTVGVKRFHSVSDNGRSGISPKCERLGLAKFEPQFPDSWFMKNERLRPATII